MVGFIVLVVAVSVISSSFASPLSATRRQSITTLSTSQIETFKPFTFFASAAYCNPSTTINWSCGGETHVSRTRRNSNLTPQQTAMQTRDSCRLHQGEMEQTHNSVSTPSGPAFLCAWRVVLRFGQGLNTSRPSVQLTCTTWYFWSILTFLP